MIYSDLFNQFINYRYFDCFQVYSTVNNAVKYKYPFIELFVPSLLLPQGSF